MPITTLPYGEAVFFGLWYVTILTLAIGVWIIAVSTIRIANTLVSIQQWLSHLAITQAVDTHNQEPRSGPTLTRW